MATVKANTAIETDSKHIKLGLEGWREAVVFLHSRLIWEQPADPGVLFGAVSFIFLIFWYLDLSVVTTAGTIGLLLVLLDFLGPKIVAHVVKPDFWTPKKEKDFEIICKELAAKKYYICGHICGLAGMRTDQPKLFYLITITSFAFLTWLGAAINNLVLTYMAVLFLVLTPGLSRRGLLDPIRNAIACTKIKMEKKD